jgi:Cytochrome c oxidase subunit III
VPIRLFIGTLALLIALIRIVLNHFTNKHHVGFESAIWYWHFVGATARLLFLIALSQHIFYRQRCKDYTYKPWGEVDKCKLLKLLLFLDKQRLPQRLDIKILDKVVFTKPKTRMALPAKQALVAFSIWLAWACSMQSLYSKDSPANSN